MDDLLNSIEASLKEKNWYAALLVTLAVPDIAGWIDDPTEGSRHRYSAWFETYVGKFYESSVGGESPKHKFLSGDDCYALRCSLLHEGRDEIINQKARSALDRFQFIAPIGELCVHCNQVNKKLQLQVDIFCTDICQGAREWLSSIPKSDQVKQSRMSELIRIQTDGSIHI